MLTLHFFGQNAHFAIHLFAALVFFAAFWLYFDAWSSKRSKKALIKGAGFFFVALSFLVHATLIEESGFGESLFGSTSLLVESILRIIGYAGIIVSELMDPLQKVPDNAGVNAADFEPVDMLQTPNTIVTPNVKSNTPAVVGLGSVGNALHVVLPFGAFAIAFLYWRRATTGLERHLKPIAIAFAVLTAYELLSLGSLWQGSDNPMIANLTASFGVLWLAEHVFLLIGSLLIGRWVWRYLTQRFFSQIFMIFLTVTLVIFLATTVSFTFLLFRNVRDESLSNLKTASSVLQYAIDGKKAETLANANAISENPEIAQRVAAKDNTGLTALTSSFLQDKKLSSLVITDFAGQVLLRAEDPARFGDSLSSDTQVRKGILNQSSSNITVQDGVLAPLVSVASTVPITDSEDVVIGTITASIVLDTAFVDGIKNATGLNSSIYAGTTRSATTFTASDSSTRYVGVKDTNDQVETTVIKNNEVFAGDVSVLNRQFLGVYTPLRDVDNTTVGMLFIGLPESSITKTAGRSVELTFLTTAALLILMTAPAYLISKFISKQLQ